MPLTRVQLFGGEQDGHTITMELCTDKVPEFLYIWPAKDNTAVADASGRTRTALCRKLAVLAYRFDELRPKSGVVGNQELIYRRDAAADKLREDRETASYCCRLNRRGEHCRSRVRAPGQPCRWHTDSPC